MLYRLLERFSKAKSSPASKWLLDYAVRYVDLYRDFSYDFEVNGERLFIQRLAKFDLRCVFDVGANIGDWSIIAAGQFPNARICSFELSANTRTTLRQRLRGAAFVVPEYALGDSAGEVSYKDYGDGSLVSTTVATSFHDASRSFELKTATIKTGDDYLAEAGINEIDLLKIDVEGAEMAVLKGFARALQQQRIRVIQFEYGFANGDAGGGNLMKDFFALLEGSGYTVGRLWSVGVDFGPFTHDLNNFDSGPNFVAVRQSDHALISALRSAA